jgi:hypothetical protein
MALYLDSLRVFARRQHGATMLEAPPQQHLPRVLANLLGDPFHSLVLAHRQKQSAITRLVVLSLGQLLCAHYL